ncbi:hypothetical protein [Kocuria palustris]|uniref:hypothetical protein n=1 Tax=Kocuria palustris TaxID=71999 RepID=UPI0011A14FC8|nr:hypothetical protein [Kocuria palustris]
MSAASDPRTGAERLGEAAAAAVGAFERIPTAAWTTAGLIGGYGIARASGVRWLGGAALLGAGAAAAHTWWHEGGAAEAGVLSTVYVLGFGLSHPLARSIGAWPSVLAVTAVSGAASWALVDRRRKPRRA